MTGQQRTETIAEMKAWAQRQLEATIDNQHWETGDAAYRILVGHEQAYKQMIKKLEQMEQAAE